jgi:uncharacterized protein (TIGR00297 family)
LGLIIISSLDSYRKKSLSKSGALSACFLGCFVYISGGFVFLTGLFVFYFSSSYMTKYKKNKKDILTKDLHEKSGKRDGIQVMANGGIPLAIALIYLINPEELLITLYFVAFSASTSDTWASEIGVLSQKRPVSILTFKKIEKGISGGISVLGIMFSFFGSFFIAIFYVLTRFQFLDLEILIENFILISILGFLGSIIDSFIGATIQPLYLNKNTNKHTEKFKEGSTKKIKGIKFFNNDVVNFVSISIMIIFAYLYFLIF